MTDQHLYLSLVPEALIFSMLPPEKFGKYLAIGDEKASSSPALFLEVDLNTQIDGVDLDKGRSRCVAHPDGSSRRSAYVSIYDVFRRVPLQSFGKLHLATADGLVLSLDRREYQPGDTDRLFLYQEVCPVTPRVATSLSPLDFCRYVTDKDNPLYLPKIIFADLLIDGLEKDPTTGDAQNLPFKKVDHLRSCLKSVSERDGKKTKIVQRNDGFSDLFYSIDQGFFVGDQNDFAFYPMPSEDELSGEHNRWRISASRGARY
ncbi:MAG: hypothetical protein AAGJ81_14525 [Verrucomicrobiota bacterium]